jgi:hypothetical protein
MESKPMSDRSGVDRQRGVSKRAQSKVTFWRFFCNPLVLKAVIAVAQMIPELLRFVERQ